MFNNFYKRTTTKQSLIVLKRRCYLWLFTSSVHTNLHTRLQTQTTITAFTCSAHAEPRLFKRTPCCDHTEMPCFSQAGFTPLRFYKRPTSVPVFANNQKSPKTIFALTNKSGDAFPVDFAMSRGSTCWEQGGRPRQAPPGSRGPPPSTSASPPQNLHCVCERLSFFSITCASVSKMRPRVSTSSLSARSPWERKGSWDTVALGPRGKPGLRRRRTTQKQRGSPLARSFTGVISLPSPTNF